ncbi:MAG: DUF2085 domain-containing protein [Sandaracinaceae bacterium]
MVAAFGVAFLSFVALALVPAVFADSPLGTVSLLLFSGLCHQLPERSFACDGHAMAICHRCTGIYLGLGAGALLSLVRPVDPTRRALLAWAVVPMGAQVMLGWIFPALDRPELRVATGLLTGVIGGLVAGSALLRARRAAP